MLGEPILIATCDGCGDEIACGLTATARGGYDERNVKADIESQGWLIRGDGHYCPNCRQKHEDDDV